MRKILILANNDIGLYKFRKELIEELLKDSEVFISLPNGEFVKELVNMGCEFIDTRIDRRGVNPIVDLKLILTYNKIIKRLKPDLVITYTIKPNIYGGLISRIRKSNYATNITGLGTSFQREGLLKKFIISMYKISLKESKIVFFENEENQNTFIDNRIIAKAKTCKLNGAGVNLNEYSYMPYPDNNEPIRFLFVGRIMKEKGIEEFLEVAKEIKSENKNIFFDIVGPKEDEYIEILTELQDKGIINYYGYQKDIRPFVIKAHCFVLPSYHEGMANTLLECGAMGRPLITSDIPGCREAVVEGKTGYLTKIQDKSDLYKNINKFLNLSYNDRAEMGKMSRIHIEKFFSKFDIVHQTVKKLELS